MTHKKANVDWDVTDAGGKVETWEKVGIAVMMDIRQELRELNRLLRCPNFLSIPAKLETIGRNTRKPKRKPKVRA